MSASRSDILSVLVPIHQARLAASAAHWSIRCRLPAILASLPSAHLSALFDEITARPRKVFLLVPFEADSSLTRSKTRGRFGTCWANDRIAHYVPLFDSPKKYVHSQIKKAGPHLRS